MTVEDPSAAGIGGSDISQEGFRLAAGVTVGPGTQQNDVPLPPPPPPPRVMRLGHKPDGQVMSALPRANLDAWEAQDWQLMHPSVKWIASIIGLIVVGLVVAFVGTWHW